jgi:hypothetical protein
LGTRTEIKGIQVAKPKALFGRRSKINKCCHKNVIDLSDSGATQSFLLVASADISGKESGTKEVELSVWSRILVNPQRDEEAGRRLPERRNLAGFDRTIAHFKCCC